jgi:hypothetical protein
MAAVLGSLVGGSAAITTAWITQRTQSKREMVLGELRKREMLYGEFISECSKLAIDALAHGMEKPETLWTAYALLNRIRLSASQAVLTEGEKVLSQIADQYYSPNISLDEFRALVRSRDADPLKPFGETCRTELKKLRAAG